MASAPPPFNMMFSGVSLSPHTEHPIYCVSNEIDPNGVLSQVGELEKGNGEVLLCTGISTGLTIAAERPDLRYVLILDTSRRVHEFCTGLFSHVSKQSTWIDLWAEVENEMERETEEGELAYYLPCCSAHTAEGRLRGDKSRLARTLQNGAVPFWMSRAYPTEIGEESLEAKVREGRVKVLSIDAFDPAAMQRVADVLRKNQLSIGGAYLSTLPDYALEAGKVGELAASLGALCEEKEGESAVVDPSAFLVVAKHLSKSTGPVLDLFPKLREWDAEAYLADSIFPDLVAAKKQAESELSS